MKGLIDFFFPTCLLYPRHTLALHSVIQTPPLSIFLVLLLLSRVDRSTLFPSLLSFLPSSLPFALFICLSSLGTPPSIHTSNTLRILYTPALILFLLRNSLTPDQLQGKCRLLPPTSSRRSYPHRNKYSPCSTLPTPLPPLQPQARPVN